MTAQIKPSTRTNLAALRGNEERINAYAEDITDLLAGDALKSATEVILARKVLEVSLATAAEEQERRGEIHALRGAAHLASAVVMAFRVDDDTLEGFLLTEAILDAAVFQLTDIDEQD